MYDVSVSVFLWLYTFNNLWYSVKCSLIVQWLIWNNSYDTRDFHFWIPVETQLMFMWLTAAPKEEVQSHRDTYTHCFNSPSKSCSEDSSILLHQPPLSYMLCNDYNCQILSYHYCFNTASHVTVTITAQQTLLRVIMLFDATAASATSACLQPNRRVNYRCSQVAYDTNYQNISIYVFTKFHGTDKQTRNRKINDCLPLLHHLIV